MVKKAFPLLMLTFLLSSFSQGQIYNHSASAGTGDAGLAAVEAGDSVFLNPATLPHLRGRHFMSSFAEDEMALSFSDNTNESALPGGIGFLQNKNVFGTNEVKNQNFSVALADFIIQQWTVGILGNHLESKINDVQGTSYRQTNVDLGFAYVHGGNIGLAAVMYNLLGENKNTPEALRLKPQVGLGLNYIYKEFVRYRLDWVSGGNYQTDSSSIRLGIETFMNKFMIWRLGYRNDFKPSEAIWTAGLGFPGPKFALNYAFQKSTKESKEDRHSIDLQIPF